MAAIAECCFSVVRQLILHLKARADKLLEKKVSHYLINDMDRMIMHGILKMHSTWLQEKQFLIKTLQAL